MNDTTYSCSIKGREQLPSKLSKAGDKYTIFYMFLIDHNLIKFIIAACEFNELECEFGGWGQWQCVHR